MNNPKSLQWPAPAKLNLFLYITGQRSDGYHQLQTLFQFINLMDQLCFEPTQHSEITLSSRLHGVPPQDNLIIKAAQALKPYAASRYAGVHIQLHKQIPIGAGLGGASSNAATTLLALNHLWQCHLSLTELAAIGVKLGADVPIFIHGHAAFAEGIGDNLSDAFPAEKWYIVVRPEVSIATRDVFTHSALPRNTLPQSLAELMQQPFANDCEAVVRQCFPLVDKAITALSRYAPARLTGTGSCIFSEFDNQQQALDLFNTVKDQFNTVFLTKGANRSPLHAFMQQQGIGAHSVTI